MLRVQSPPQGRTPQSRAAGMVLFKKAWEAFPAERARLIGYLGDEVWKLPEVIDYAKQTLRPNADLVRRDPWMGLQTGGISYSSNGQMTTGMNRLLSAASQASQLDELRGEVAAAVQENQNWLAGPVLLALIDLKQKKEVDIPAIAKPLIEANSPSSSLSYTRLVFAQEIESRPQYRDLAIQLYSSAMLSGGRSWPQFQFSPANHLMQLYKQAGRQSEAVDLLRKMTRDEASSTSPFANVPQIRTQNLVEIAKQFEQLDAPADAQQIRTFNARGHEYSVPGQQAAGLARSAGHGQDVVSTGSIGRPRSYTSANDHGVNASAAVPQVAHTINVWGARIDGPVQSR